MKLNHLDLEVRMIFDPAYEIMLISFIFIVFCIALLFSTMTATFHFMTIVLIIVGLLLFYFKCDTKFLISDDYFKWYYFKGLKKDNLSVESIESIQFFKNKIVIKTKKNFKYDLYFYSKQREKVQSYIEKYLPDIDTFKEDSTNKTF